MLARDEATGLPIASFRTRHARARDVGGRRHGRNRSASATPTGSSSEAASVPHASDTLKTTRRVLPNLGFAETLSEPTTRGGDALTLRSRSVFESSEYDALLAVGPSSIAQAVEMLSARPFPGRSCCSSGPGDRVRSSDVRGVTGVADSGPRRDARRRGFGREYRGAEGAMIGIEPTAAPSMKQRWRLRAHERSRDAPGGEIQNVLALRHGRDAHIFPARDRARLQPRHGLCCPMCYHRRRGANRPPQTARSFYNSR